MAMFLILLFPMESFLNGGQHSLDIFKEECMPDFFKCLRKVVAATDLLPSSILKCRMKCCFREGFFIFRPT